MQREPGLIRWE